MRVCHQSGHVINSHKLCTPPRASWTEMESDEDEGEKEEERERESLRLRFTWAHD